MDIWKDFCYLSIMIIVKFFSSFGTSEDTLNIYNRALQILDMHEIRFTVDNDYTHAVILNTAMPNLQIPKENVLGLAFEPPAFLGLTTEFVKYAQQYIGRYYIGFKGDLPEPFIEHHGFMWYAPFPQTILPKTKVMSIIFSEKINVFGHQYRHRLVHNILQTNWPIDIYGYGCRILAQLGRTDTRIKGPFQEAEPFDGYQFSIAIENFRLPAYFTEKLLSCLVYGCTPLYYGASAALDEFPDTIIPLTGTLETDLLLIMNVCKNPNFYAKTIDRLSVVRKMNICEELTNKK